MPDVDPPSASTPPATPLRAPDGFWSGLGEGLRRPSWTAIGLALGCCALALVGLERWMNVDLLVSDARGYLAIDDEDTHVWASGRLYELLREPQDTPLVAVIGSSGIVEAMTEEEELEGFLRELVGDRVRAADLSCFDQSILEAPLLMDRLPERFDGVVVVGVSPRLIGRGWRWERPFGDRLAVRSAAVEELARGLGLVVEEQTGDFFWDNRRFFLPRIPSLLANALRGPRHWRRHLYRDSGRMGEDILEKQYYRVRLAMEHYLENRPAALELLGTVGRSLQERGRVRVVLLETPVRPSAIPVVYGDELYREHGECMQRFAAENGFEYWNLSQEAALGENDYYDYTHLCDEDAQRRFTKVLARRAAEILTEERQ